MSTPARGAKWKNFAAKPGKSVTARAYTHAMHRGEGRAVKRFLCILLFLLFLPVGAGSCASEELSVAAKGDVYKRQECDSPESGDKLEPPSCADRLAAHSQWFL